MKPGPMYIKEYLDHFIEDLKSFGRYSDNVYEGYSVIKEIIEDKLRTFIKIAQGIGHLQILRKVILTQLHITSRVDSKALYLLVESLNNIFLKKVSKFKRQDPTQEPDELIAEKRKKAELEMKLITYVGLYSDSIGISNALQKMFTNIRTDLFSFSVFMALATIYAGDSMVYTQKFYTYVRKPKAAISVDGMDLLYGLASIMHHGHYNFTVEYICFVSQYIKSAMGKEGAKQDKIFSLLQCFIEDFCIVRGIDLQSLRLFYPDYARFSMAREMINNK